VYVTPRLRAIIDRQKEFYDGIASHSGNFEKLVAKEYSRRRKRKLRAEALQYRRYHITGRILDIGCGLGGFLQAAMELGWQYPEGIEIAPQAAEYVRKFFPVQTQPIEEVYYEANRFDLVRLNNVIEHLPSPKALVRAVHRILRPGGLFAFSTPNFDSLSVAIWGRDWPYFGGKDHIYLFGPKTLTRLLEDSGFRAIRTRTKGIHLAVNNHTGYTPHTPLPCLPNAVFTGAEKALDLIIRHTLKGHRLKVWAEKV
jgi:2-polyprenyl-3-methyl-5-hydroxy-6-metoxy-1,4-benzoquinol methylase